MGVGKIGNRIIVSGGTGSLIIRWLESTDPLAEIGRSDAFAIPYNSVYTILNLRPVVHIVQLWRSADGVALTTLITQWQQDAAIYNVVSSITYEYQAGRGTTEGTIGEGDYWIDPTNGSDELTDERIDGATKDDLVVHEAGFGNKQKVEYELKSGGGIILNGGKTFDDPTAWFITHNRLVAQQITETESGSTEIVDVAVIIADTDFYTDASNNLYNKLVIANGAGTNLKVTFGAFATIPNGTRARFQTHRGNQNYLQLQFNPGETVWLNGKQVNVISLAKGQEIKIWFKGGVCYIDYVDPFIKLRGVIIGDSQNRQVELMAFLLCDESTGVKDKADFEGFYAWLLELPPGVCATSVAVWNTNKRRFMLDEVNEQFRVPHLSDIHRRFVVTGETPHEEIAAVVGSHIHPADNTDPNMRYIKRKPGGPGGGLGLNASLGGFELQEFNTGNNHATATENTVKSYTEIPMVIL